MTESRPSSPRPFLLDGYGTDPAAVLPPDAGDFNFCLQACIEAHQNLKEHLHH